VVREFFSNLLDKFRDLMASEELYFRREDKFKNDDPQEGLPPDDYVRKIHGLERYVVKDELKLNNTQAVNRQFSEMNYLNCWNLFEGEKLEMWREYAPEGVAACSRYDLLKSILDLQLDCMHLGLVLYGHSDLTGDNILRYAYHKCERFAGESEVRAVLSCSDPVAANNRHYNELNFPNREPLDDVYPLPKWVKDFKRRRIDLKALVTGFVVSPWASKEVYEEVQQWVKRKQFSLPVSWSSLAGPFTPTLAEWDKLHPKPKQDSVHAGK
jgi:hypothetical protein